MGIVKSIIKVILYIITAIVATIIVGGLIQLLLAFIKIVMLIALGFLVSGSFKFKTKHFKYVIFGIIPAIDNGKFFERTLRKIKSK